MNNTVTINPPKKKAASIPTDKLHTFEGHRRLHATKKAGLYEVPALIYPLDRNEASIAVVDSNLHRERLLPSEKAFAYKLKMEAMKQQGALSSDSIYEIMSEEKANQQEHIRFKVSDLQGFFPKHYTA